MKYRITKKDERKYELITDVHDFGSFGKIPVVEYYRNRENAEKRIKELKGIV